MPYKNFGAFKVVNIVDDRLVGTSSSSGNTGGSPSNPNSRIAGMGPAGPGVQVCFVTNTILKTKDIFYVSFR